SGTTDFVTSTDTSKHLTINAADSTTTTESISASFNAIAGQTVALNASVVSTAGTVNEGQVIFKIIDSSSVVKKTSGAIPVTDGVPGIPNFQLPANLAVGTYTVEVDYTDSPTGDFASSDTKNNV